MDCQMPEMDGFEATRQIRLTEGKDGRKAIIAMTANAVQGDRERCLEAGMDDYLSKPVEPSKLAAMIERWLPKMELESLDIEPEIQAGDSRKNMLPVFDGPSFLGRVMGDGDLMHMLITVFLEDMPIQLGKLVEAVDARDAKQAEQQAHRIMGAAANMSAEAMRETAATMEAAGRDGDLDALKRGMPELQERFVELAGVLRGER